MHFSDTLLSSVEHAFNDMMLLRNPEPEDVEGPVRAVLLGPDYLSCLRAEVERVQRDYPDAAILACFNRERDMCEAFRDMRAGGWKTPVSLVPLDVRLDVWLSILKLAMMGTTYVPVAASLKADEGVARKPRCLSKLTDRESEVLALAAKGAQNKTIAHALEVSEHTVKLHMHHIIKKLGVRNRTQAAQQLMMTQG
ncbi:response regulator transcription factor [Maribius pontilimi]|uniref:Response regulator transcription factor n=1 Tax=Palleronia pontilimi TaxID=1964209 RepID=A0A934MCB8_9RHOB|nr:response regulator transcription factor [Palleronia pontilimi]